jgi:hypothetical protein
LGNFLQQLDTSSILKPMVDYMVKTSSGAWGRNYHDMAPNTDRTPAGAAFLSTNFVYFITGIILLQKGDVMFSIIVELAGLASFNYHYCQIHFGSNIEEVRGALLIDNIFAVSATAATIVEMFSFAVKAGDSVCAPGTLSKTLSSTLSVLRSVSLGEFPFELYSLQISVDSFWYGVAAVICLYLSWIMEKDVPYMIIHGLWHMLSALTVINLRP